MDSNTFTPTIKSKTDTDSEMAKQYCTDVRKSLAVDFIAVNFTAVYSSMQ